MTSDKSKQVADHHMRRNLVSSKPKCVLIVVVHRYPTFWLRMILLILSANRHPSIGSSPGDMLSGISSDAR